MTDELKSIRLKLRQAIYFVPLYGVLGLMFACVMIYTKDKDPNYGYFIFGFGFLIFVCYFYYYKYKLYMPCPYCNKSTLVKEDWKCDYCNNFQGKPRFLNEKCVHCRRVLKTAFCEHCHEEFKI